MIAFRKSIDKKLEEIEMDIELKEFLLNLNKYKKEYDLMIKENEKISKKDFTKLFLLDNNVHNQIIANTNKILNLANKDYKKIIVYYGKHNKQFKRTAKILNDNKDLADKQEELFAVNASFKELASEQQWKTNTYFKMFNNTINFVTEFDTKYFHEIDISPTEKHSVLTMLKEKLKTYGFIYKDINELEDKLTNNSKIIKNFQKNLYYVAKF